MGTDSGTSLAKRLCYEPVNTRQIHSENQNAKKPPSPPVSCPIIEPLNYNYQPAAKKVTKTKLDKAYDKACKAAEAANKKFNRASECLKVCVQFLCIS